LIPPEERIPLGPISQRKPKAVRIKIEFSDDSGTKYSFNVEGNSKENINKIIDLAQSISSKQPEVPVEDHPAMDTNFAKLYDLLEARFRFGSFTSSDVLEAYQDDFQVPTSLSVISTYLSRMANRGLLTRSRNGAGWIYKLAKLHPPTDEPEVLRNDIPP
jgi:hypothetical protein